MNTTSLITLLARCMASFRHPAVITTRPPLIVACDNASHSVGRNSFVQTITCPLLTTIISDPENK